MLSQTRKVRFGPIRIHCSPIVCSRSDRGSSRLTALASSSTVRPPTRGTTHPGPERGEPGPGCYPEV